MSDDRGDYASLPRLTARDPDVKDLFPRGFEDLYDVTSYRNAARVLSGASQVEFVELANVLGGFRIRTQDIVAGGKNKSEIAKSMESALHPMGWAETRIQADLVVRKTFALHQGPEAPKSRRGGASSGDERVRTERYVVPNFIDGHKVDFVKGRIAFDMEWNSKDQTFDRDLYAMRALYECGLIDAGVLLTRSAELQDVFREISRRVEIKDFKSKFGASTTWIGKLTYRLDAGRAGGCPILALAIKPPVIGDLEQWKSRNPIIKDAVDMTLSHDDEDRHDA